LETKIRGSKYRYVYEGQSLEAEDIGKAFRRHGLAFPEGLNTGSNFVIRVWYWNETTEDYDIEKLGGAGHQRFNEYTDALQLYKRLEVDRDFRFQEGEVKLELVHFRNHEYKVILSRVLFGMPLVGEP